MVWLNLKPLIMIEPLSSSDSSPSQEIRLDQGLWFAPSCGHPVTLHVQEQCPSPPRCVPFFFLGCCSKRPPEVDSQA